MREIGIRQFQQELYKQVQDLPFVVTRKGVKLFVVSSPSILTGPHVQMVQKNSGAERADEDVDMWQKQCTAPNQKCREFGKAYTVTAFGDMLEDIVETAYLCDKHRDMALAQGARVDEA